MALCFGHAIQVQHNATKQYLSILSAANVFPRPIWTCSLSAKREDWFRVLAPGCTGTIYNGAIVQLRHVETNLWLYLGYEVQPETDTIQQICYLRTHSPSNWRIEIANERQRWALGIPFRLIDIESNAALEFPGENKYDFSPDLWVASSIYTPQKFEASLIDTLAH